MKIIFVKHKGCNLEFITNVLNCAKDSFKIITIRLEDFCKSQHLIDTDDIILYQTWPDDRLFKNGNINKPILDKKYDIRSYNHPKFPKELIEETDKQFIALKNKVKILVDLHDDGDEDAFSRFTDENYIFIDNELKKCIEQIPKTYFYEIPRIKNTPSINYKKKFNVLLDVTFYINTCTSFDLKKFNDNQDNRQIMFHYYATDKNNKIRPIIKNILKDHPNVSHEIIKDYPKGLLNVMVEIGVPGYGKGCFRHIDSLNNGCLLLAYHDIADTYLLPNYLLIENEDYILFNEDNILSKIEWIMNNPEQVNKIRLNGNQKFKKYYDIATNSKIFKEKISSLIDV